MAWRESSKDDDEYVGDFGTPEQEIPATGLPGVDWESCMTMNDTWGFRTDDTALEIDRDAVRQLIDICLEGGQLPVERRADRRGRDPRRPRSSGSAMAKWMAVNGESIYGTRPAPSETRLGPLHAEARQALPTRLQLAARTTSWAPA